MLSGFKNVKKISTQFTKSNFSKSKWNFKNYLKVIYIKLCFSEGITVMFFLFMLCQLFNEGLDPATFTSYAQCQFENNYHGRYSIQNIDNILMELKAREALSPSAITSAVVKSEVFDLEQALPSNNQIQATPDLRCRACYAATIASCIPIGTLLLLLGIKIYTIVVYG